jgi:hypothetical protein
MADGETCIDSGLLSNQHAITSVASTPAADSSLWIVLAMRWCCVVVATVVALELPPAHRELLTWEREVTSLSISYSR